MIRQRSAAKYNDVNFRNHTQVFKMMNALLVVLYSVRLYCTHIRGCVSLSTWGEYHGVLLWVCVTEYVGPGEYH